MSSLVAATGTDPTTPIGADLPTLMRTCEQYVPLAAFTGDVEMQALWASVTQDATVLSIWCAEIAASDPARLAPMVDGLALIGAGLEPAATSAPPATVIARGTRGVMPDVVCTLLHDARAALADAGVFAVTALDLSGGTGDTDEGVWIVVTQSPLRRTSIGDAPVRLGVLRPGVATSC